MRVVQIFGSLSFLSVGQHERLSVSPERLQKVLASAGIASRRDCEELIAAGRVTVNGRVVTVPGTRVDLEHDEVLVDGQPLRMPAKRTYIMLHKPAGVVSTAEDTHGRPTVVDLVDVPARVFPVGRLDLDSEGLILLTDDGELAYALTHPSFEVEKEYRVLLDRALTPDALRSWRNGVLLEGEMTAPAWVELLETTPEGVWVRIVLREGRKRQIRAVARLLGYEVRRLIRVREGPLQLGDLPPRAWRHLTDEEVAALRAHVSVRRSLADAPTRPTDVVKSRALDEKPHRAGASAPVTRQRSEHSERRSSDRSRREQRDERVTESPTWGETDARTGRAPRGRQDSRGEAGRGAWGETDARAGRAPRGRQDSRGEAGREAWGEADVRTGRGPRGRQDSRGEAGREAWGEADARAGRAPRGRQDSRGEAGRGAWGETDARAGRAPRGRQDSRGEAGRGAWGETDARAGRAPRGRQDSRGEAGRGAWGETDARAGRAPRGRQDERRNTERNPRNWDNAAQSRSEHRSPTSHRDTPKTSVRRTNQSERKPSSVRRSDSDQKTRSNADQE